TCRFLIRAGCRIDVFVSASAFLIGDGSICRARPTGLSGCVTTATRSCSLDCNKTRSVGTPISPAPMNTMRMPHYGVSSWSAVVHALQDVEQNFGGRLSCVNHRD